MTCERPYLTPREWRYVKKYHPISFTSRLEEVPRVDKKGYYHLDDEGRKWRPLIDGNRLDNPRYAKEREEHRTRIERTRERVVVVRRKRNDFF